MEIMRAKVVAGVTAAAANAAPPVTGKLTCLRVFLTCPGHES